ncbi:hypothetical protein N7475_007701 [Penicillium sp. IBT 31633x]|nr:hypothetical protein N7475_007701 [Penicillium sp. IBT 31633x]
MSDHPQERLDPDTPYVRAHSKMLTPDKIMLQSALPGYIANNQEETCHFPPGYPVYYFFYGTRGKWSEACSV